MGPSGFVEMPGRGLVGVSAFGFVLGNPIVLKFGGQEGWGAKIVLEVIFQFKFSLVFILLEI